MNERVELTGDASPDRWRCDTCDAAPREPCRTVQQHHGPVRSYRGPGQVVPYFHQPRLRASVDFRRNRREASR